jgi:uncharacterized protein
MDPAFPGALPIGAPRAFHLLAKPTGAVCNLDCQYSFFLSKETLYPGSRSRMADDVLELYVRQLLEAHGGEEEVTVAWQGGEPTLTGLDFFMRSVDLVEKYRRPDQKVLHTMQTNGTKLDDAWCAFFEAHNFLIGLSVDGPKAIHDPYRVNKGDAGSFDQVMCGWEALSRHQVDCNTLCTVHAANAGHPEEIYGFFRDERKAEFVQLIPIVERATEETLPLADHGWSERPGGDRPLYSQHGDLLTARSVKIEQCGQFLIAIFEEWVRRDASKVFVQMFDVALASWVGMPTLCVFSPTCGNALAPEHSGDLYSCDHFVEPDYLLGNIRDTHMLGLVAPPKQRQFGNHKQDALPRYCRECEVRFACHGGCPKDRFISAPDGKPGLNYLCAGYKLLFRHIDGPMRVMADLIRRSRYADEIMASYAAEDARLSQVFSTCGRNDKCPCGSGL